MTGPAFFSGGMNIAKNYDWVQGFILMSQQPDDTLVPVDLTGSLLWLEIRKRDTDHEALISVRSDEGNIEDGGIEITSRPGGAFTIIITRDLLKRLYPGDYVADLVRVRPDGKWERMWDASPVEVTTGVTRGTV